jgi:hypothetical protein
MVTWNGWQRMYGRWKYRRFACISFDLIENIGMAYERDFS